MNLEAFLSERQPAWSELDELSRRAHGRPERLGADGVLRLGQLYRGAVADLAQARRAFGPDPAVRSLEQVVVRARATLYATAERRGSVRAYLGGGYWRAVRARSRALVIAWLAIIISTALAVVWARHDPAAAVGVVPGSLAGGSSPHRAIGLAADQSAALSVQIFVNNIGVSFLAFASGIALGILPVFSLIYNGLILGAVAGLVSGSGHTAAVLSLLVPHGMLELSCIAVSAAAGMQMGWAIVEPGGRTRRAALVAEAQEAALLVVATAPWLVMAGLVEGFVTPRRLPLAAALAVGVALAGPWWLFVARAGRRGEPPPESPEG